MVQVPPDREQRIGAAFVALADTLADGYDVIDVLRLLTGFCAELLTADAVGVVLADLPALQVVASSTEDPVVVGLLHVPGDASPWARCLRTAAHESVPDLAAAAGGWPELTAAAGPGGPAGALHALPLRLRGDAIGVLSLFHRRAGPMPAADRRLGQALSDVATIGILQEQTIHRGEVLNDQLRSALVSRVVIEQAKGVLAQRGGLDVEVAFERLRRYSRSRNERLGEVARRVVYGDLAAAVLGRPAR